MFEKVLVANRGEIALRVIAALPRSGSTDSCGLLDSRPGLASRRPCRRGHLHRRGEEFQQLLECACHHQRGGNRQCRCNPSGLRFSRRGSGFAEICRDCGIRFIGPSPEAIRLMGDKAQARRAAKNAGIPVLPGADEPLQTIDEVRSWAAETGFPVILKASRGGGGRGMRIVREAKNLETGFDQARSEAEAAFGCGEVYLEKYVERPRHIEFQVLGDDQGNVVSLGERECSIQRRHQKLIEEAPANGFSADLREQMGEILSRALGEIQYSNAGTVEFLMDEDGQLHFIELNARIQVEHPVTEAVSGIDLVRSQLRLAAGEPLSEVLPGPPEVRGHAIECRVNAEDPVTFRPCAGRIGRYAAPGGPGIRVDSAAYSGGSVLPHYDSLVAKVIAHGRNREEAIQRMQRALSMYVLDGIKTSIPLHQRILNEPAFVAGRYDTKFIEELGL